LSFEYQVKLTQEELAAIIEQTQSKLEDLEVEENEDEENGDADEGEAAASVEVKKEEVEDESEDVIKKYGLDTYDDEGKNFNAIESEQVTSSHPLFTALTLIRCSHPKIWLLELDRKCD
jgi:hypothetical protein